MTNRVANRDAQWAVGDKRDFVGSNLRGGYGVQGFGEMPRWAQDAYVSHRNQNGGDLYTIVSYRTPIAWHFEGEWYVPDVKYSATTSKHLTQTGLKYAALYFSEDDF